MQIYWKPGLANRFEFDVETPEEARGCLDAIATYHLMLRKFDRPTGGLRIMDGEKSVEWDDAEGEGIFTSCLIVGTHDSDKECIGAYQAHLRRQGLIY